MLEVISARDLKPGFRVVVPDGDKMIVSSVLREEACTRVRFQGDGNQYRFPLSWGVWVEAADFAAWKEQLAQA